MLFVQIQCLRKLGVLCCTEGISEKIEKGICLGRGSVEEVALRARACEAIILMAAAKGTVSQVEIGNYLWGVLGILFPSPFSSLLLLLLF